MKELTEYLSILQFVLTVVLIPIAGWIFGIVKDAAKRFVIEQFEPINLKIEAYKKSSEDKIDAVKDSVDEVKAKVDLCLKELAIVKDGNDENMKNVLASHLTEIKTVMSRTGQPWTSDKTILKADKK